MTKRNNPPRVETLRIPTDGEVCTSVLRVFEEFYRDGPSSLATLTYRADKYESLAYEALEQAVAPAPPRTVVTKQIEDVGNAASELVRAISSASGDAVTALNSAMSSLKDMPDHWWTESTHWLTRTPDTRWPPTKTEMKKILEIFAQRATADPQADHVFLSPAPSRRSRPTLAGMEYAALWLAVLAKLATSPIRGESRKLLAVHEIAHHAACDYFIITGTSPDRSTNRGRFGDFLRNIFDACCLGQLGADSTGYLQPAVEVWRTDHEGVK